MEYVWVVAKRQDSQRNEPPLGHQSVCADWVRTVLSGPRHLREQVQPESLMPQVLSAGTTLLKILWEK